MGLMDFLLGNPQQPETRLAQGLSSGINSRGFRQPARYVPQNAMAKAYDTGEAIYNYGKENPVEAGLLAGSAVAPWPLDIPLEAGAALTHYVNKPEDLSWANVGMDAASVALPFAFPGMAKVFQGSPHKYGPEGAAKSLEHMGKGEGAQAYGWGRYDAEADQVASDYRKTLSSSDRVMSVDGKETQNDFIRNILINHGSPEEYIRKANIGLGHSEKKLASASKADDLGIGVTDYDIALSDHNSRLKDIAEAQKYVGKDIKFNDAGYLYEHDLPDEAIAKYLDWDKPLSEQPESVKKALLGDLSSKDLAAKVKAEGRTATEAEKLQMNFRLRQERGDFDPTGERIYNIFVEKAKGVDGSGSAADFNSAYQQGSEALGAAGIPGLKYFDGQSRKPTSALTVNKEGSKWRASIVDNSARNNQGVLKSQDFDTEEAAAAWGRANQQAEEGTRNFVTWDQPTLDSMTLLKRNDEQF